MDKATKFLVEAFNKHSKGRGGNSLPQNMWASGDLFDAFKGECLAIERIVPDRAHVCGSPHCWCRPSHNIVHELRFKSSKLHRVNLPGWWVTFSDPKESM